MCGLSSISYKIFTSRKTSSKSSMAVALSFPCALDTATKQFHLLSSVLSGIIACRVVYKLTAFVSRLYFKGYGKLTDAQKVEWNNRGFSTFHALFVASASLYLLLLSGLFYEDSRDELVVNRTSTLSNSTLGISIGYFLSDLAMILFHFPALGGMEYLLHHGLSMLSIILALLSGQAQIYILMVLFSEITTPFVNLRWYLDVAGQKSSKLYLWNGVLLFMGWLVARILMFIFFFRHMFIHFDQVKQIFPLGFYSILVIPGTLAVMNVLWFWKIVKGLMKTLSKARHGQ
ncbi:transmembrane protein 56-B [Populus alba x Populus x berolinensis]|uniref:TLC domain-containing protein n=1 Tax=Populus davidiana TaxID=266767 RepID=A0A6M2F0X3_9ROSI|nr:transmembrane protein 56-B [Populus alba x Populus x berolinensis]